MVLIGAARAGHGGGAEGGLAVAGDDSSMSDFCKNSPKHFTLQQIWHFWKVILTQNNLVNTNRILRNMLHAWSCRELKRCNDQAYALSVSRSKVFYFFIFCFYNAWPTSYVDQDKYQMPLDTSHNRNVILEQLNLLKIKTENNVHSLCETKTNSYYLVCFSYIFILTIGDFSVTNKI